MTTHAGARTIQGVTKKSVEATTDGGRDAGAAGFGARLAEAMTARGLSGGELGRRTGFTSQYVNSLQKGDRGARLPHDTAKRLAHALGVSVEWLTRGDGPRERLSDVYPTHVQRARPFIPLGYLPEPR